MSRNAVTCSACGAAVSDGDNFAGFCLSCLLAAGFEEDQPVDALNYDHYKVITDEAGEPVLLGRGTMGVTYRAIDTTLQSEVALKVIEPNYTDHPFARERFMREARTAFKLRHPNVASVLYAGFRADNRCFYTMELVEGETLEARVRRAGPLPISTALDLALQIGRALQRAEQLGVVHRDLKPSNLMLTGCDQELVVKVIDFGVAKATGNEPGGSEVTRSTFVGTPAFASPEHFTGQAHDSRSDFFSLGATIWYMLCGQPPFPGQTQEEIRRLQLKSKVPTQQLRARRVPRPLIELLCSLLAGDPDRRPQTAEELQTRIKACQGSWQTSSPGKRHSRVLLIGSILVSTIAAVWLVSLWSQSHSELSVLKSLAVLPFENLSKNAEESYFADGVQDEILTDLAKLSELKVISRNSVQSYRDPAKRPGTREIATTLGVTYLLEGSVQKEGNHVRVNARLLDATNDREIWGTQYDGDQGNLFTMQIDLAQQIANQLQVQLSAAERTGIHKAPTEDFVAYELYLRAKQLYYDFDDDFAADARQKLDDSVLLLKEATQRDPHFSEAWLLLANIHGAFFYYGYERFPSRRTEAYEALQRATELDPGAAENHLVRAFLVERLDSNYDQAITEVKQALKRLPNSSLGYYTSGRLAWIQGRYAEVEPNLVRASELDPRWMRTVKKLISWYCANHQYDAAAKLLDGVLAAGVESDYFRLRKAEIPFETRADTASFRACLSSIPKTGDAGARLTLARWELATWDRNYAEAYAALDEYGKESYLASSMNIVYPRAYFEGVTARAAGDSVRATKSFQEALPIVQKQAIDHPKDPGALYLLAITYARLGQKESALAEGRRMIELVPLEKNHESGAHFQDDLAEIYAWSGEKDLAIQILQNLAKIPLDGFNYGILKLDPSWDIFRDDPRFNQLINDLAPPDLKQKQ
jgi:eukaryotic-like serine/threonine-protein kinase